MRRFLGDYLNVEENREILRVASLGVDSILFSLDVEMLVDRFMRGPKIVPLELVLTETQMTLIRFEVDKSTGQDVRVLERKTSARSIRSVSTSMLVDDWIVLHMDDEVDLVLKMLFKTEFLTQLQRVYQGNLPIKVVNRIVYHRKPGKTSELSVIAKVELGREISSLKGHSVYVGSGEPAFSG
jgi:myosin-1